jgi:pSer/pThr/pTyr-binding forkhead associated (FHA) protein
MSDVTYSICSACGQANLPGEMFCKACGVQLAPVASVPPPPPRPLPLPSTDSSFQGGQAVTAGKTSKLVLPAKQVEFQLPTDRLEILLGRSDPVREIYPDLDLAEHGGESSGVSRVHARLVLQDGHFYLEDLNSTNFTYINQKRLQPGETHLLNPGDEIRLGMLVLIFRTS